VADKIEMRTSREKKGKNNNGNGLRRTKGHPLWDKKGEGGVNKLRAKKICSKAVDRTPVKNLRLSKKEGGAVKKGKHKIEPARTQKRSNDPWG